MKTGEQVCREHGIDFDQFPDGVPAEEFWKRNIPMIVQCFNCTMTMSFPCCLVGDDHRVWCRDCGETDEEEGNCVPPENPHEPELWTRMHYYTGNPGDVNYLPVVLRPPPEDYQF